MSRATLVNDEVVEQTEVETSDLFEAAEEMQPEPQESDDDIPEKYRGKSIKDLVKMHQEAEEVFQKHSAEVGETRKEVTELRSVVDNYIQKELTNQAPQQEKVDDSEDVDFFVDPVKAVDSRINNHPKIKEAEQITDNYKKQTALSQLQAQHPDMEEILNDSKFAEWVQQSPIRTKLAAQADQLYDVEAANELFSLYKERNSMVAQTVEAERNQRSRAVKTASTGGARGSNDGIRKNVYRRSDIINMMINEPDKYKARSGEFLKAYEEGRVV
tara:strand:+ start:10 stop:825 length:816 start_codon:yes stop_codon:yes gene_type:complete